MDLEVTEDLRDGDSRWETGDVPAELREQVLDRDQHMCRLCGSWAESPAVHHIRYRSEGGLNRLDNLVTLHWMYRPACHELAHSRKRLYQPLLLEVIQHGGVSVLQLQRWKQQRDRNARLRERLGLTQGGPV